MARNALVRLPPPFDLATAAARYPPRRSASLNTVLVQEMARFNGLLAVVRASLAAIDQALQARSLLIFTLEFCLTGHSCLLSDKICRNCWPAEFQRQRWPLELPVVERP